MGLISDGISNVRAFAIAGGVAGSGRFDAVVGRALVTWRSTHSGRLHQVYVNGKPAGVTADAEQRRLVVAVPASVSSAVRIEVCAVASEDADKDFGEELEPAAAGGGRVRIGVLRSQSLPIGGDVRIYSDGDTGTVDYSSVLANGSVRLWAARQDKSGFGMSCFGGSDFGYDGAAAVGFGKGCFAEGAFGFDADRSVWVSEALEKGDYLFGVEVSDADGVEGAAGEIGPVFVGAAAAGAEELAIESFDRAANRLVLSVG